MSQFWQNVLKSVKTGLAVSSEKIEEYSHIGKLKLDHTVAKRNKDRLCRELGEKVYGMRAATTKKDLRSDEDVKGIMEKISAAEKVLSDLEERLAEASQKEAPAAAEDSKQE